MEVHIPEKMFARGALVRIILFRVRLRRPGAGSCTISWRVKLGKDESIPTLFPLFEGADWQEREQYDLVGVVFSEHPDLRRLMMPEDWPGYPLQKEYAIDTPHAPWR